MIDRCDFEDEGAADEELSAQIELRCRVEGLDGGVRIDFGFNVTGSGFDEQRSHAIGSGTIDSGPTQQAFGESDICGCSILCRWC